MAEGQVSQKLGFSNPAEGNRPGPSGNTIGAPHAPAPAPAQLSPTEPIGIQPARPPAQQAQHGGPRLPDFSKGMMEGVPGMGDDDAGGAAAGGGEAAGAGDLLKMAAMFVK